MNTRIRIGLAASVALLAIFFWVHSCRPLDIEAQYDQPSPLATEVVQPLVSGSASTPAARPDQPPEPPPEGVALFRAFFAQVISIHGRVTDQSNNAIPDAHVQLTVHDKPGEKGTDYVKTTDNDGRFEIIGVTGASVNVELSKDGYYSGKESRRIIDAGEKSSVDNPMIFLLHKKGEGLPVVYLRSATVGLKEQGGVAYLDFEHGRLTALEGNETQMRIEIVSSQGRQRGRAWKFKLSLLGGGLQKRNHEFAFNAPASGYVEIIEGGYSEHAADDPDWRGSFGDHFFALLPDGSVARFQINLGVKGGPYVEISQLVYNPDSNSKNLEYDPLNTIPTGR